MSPRPVSTIRSQSMGKRERMRDGSLASQRLQPLAASVVLYVISTSPLGMAQRNLVCTNLMGWPMTLRGGFLYLIGATTEFRCSMFLRDLFLPLLWRPITICPQVTFLVRLTRILAEICGAI